jgi:hypothetical protein
VKKTGMKPIEAAQNSAQTPPTNQHRIANPSRRTQITVVG